MKKIRKISSILKKVFLILSAFISTEVYAQRIETEQFIFTNNVSFYRELQATGGVNSGTFGVTGAVVNAGVITGGTLIVNGNVGIGTNDPASKLEVLGTNIRITHPSAPTYYGLYTVNGIDAYGSSQYLRFLLSGDEKLTIAPSGDVGIGTNSPTTKLHVVESSIGPYTTGVSYSSLLLESTTYPGITIAGADGTIGGIRFNTPSSGANGFAGLSATYADETTLYNNNADGYLTFRTGAYGERMRIDKSGNVGIGTNAPSSKLHIADNAPAIRLQTKTAGTTETPVDRKIIWGNYADAEVGSINLLDHSASEGRADMTFSMNHSDGLLYEDMRIRNGNVGIGTNNPATKLFVYSGNNYPAAFKGISGPAITVLGSISGTPAVQGYTDDAFSSPCDLVLQPNGRNVGIGVTNPATALHVSGYETLSSSASGSFLTLQNTTPSNNAYTGIAFSENAISGDRARIDGIVELVGNGSGALSLKTATSGGVMTEAMRVNSDQKVGIGTANPVSTLDVNGTTTVGNASIGLGISKPQLVSQSYVSSGIIFTNSKSDAPDVRNWAMLSDQTAYGDFHIKQSTSLGGNPLVGASRIVIDPSGNVGIGTNSPTTKLQVNGNIGVCKSDYGFDFSDSELTLARGSIGGSTNKIRFMSSIPTAVSNMVYDTGLIESTFDGNSFSDARLSLKYPTGVNTWGEGLSLKNGNIGIGTNAPIYNLDVAKNEVGGNVNVTIRNTDNTDPASHARLILHSGGASGGDPVIIMGPYATYYWSMGVDNSDADKFMISSSADVGTDPRLTIDTSGNVGIGTTNPISKLMVLSSGSNPSILTLRSTSNDENPLNLYYERTSASPAANDEIHRTYSLGRNSASEVIEYVLERSGIVDPDDGTEDSYVETMTYQNGAQTSTLMLKSGNVGIGTTNPKTNLNIYSYSYDVSAMLEGNLAVNKASVDFKTVAGNAYVTSKIVGSGEVHNDAGYLGFYTRHYDDGLLERMRINYAGNVGIGTNNPGAVLDISHATSPTLRLSRKGNVAATSQPGLIDTYAPNASGGLLQWSTMKTIVDDATAGTEDSSIQFATMKAGTLTDTLALQSGNVGLGTTSPDTKLQVISGESSSGIEVADSSGGARKRMVMAVDSTAGFLDAYNVGSGVLPLKIQPNGGNSIFGSGNVGIGTNNPGAKLHVVGNAHEIRSTFPSVDSYSSVRFFQNDLTIGNITAIGTNYSDLTIAGSMQLNTEGAYPVIFGTSGTEKMRITSGGYVGIGTNNPTHLIHLAGGAYCDGTGDWIAGSDAKWKRNINSISTNQYGVNTVLKMNPVSYIHKNDTNNLVQLGFIAQELKPIVPEVVTGKEGDYGIAYGRIVPVLVNAIKEQNAMIKEQNDMIKSLQKRLEALENKK